MKRSYLPVGSLCSWMLMIWTRRNLTVDRRCLCVAPVPTPTTYIPQHHIDDMITDSYSIKTLELHLMKIRHSRRCITTKVEKQVQREANNELNAQFNQFKMARIEFVTDISPLRSQNARLLHCIATLRCTPIGSRSSARGQTHFTHTQHTLAIDRSANHSEFIELTEWIWTICKHCCLHPRPQQYRRARHRTEFSIGGAAFI